MTTDTDTRLLASVPTFPFSMFDPVHLGRDEYGAHVHVNLAERNMLLGGEPGAGKSSGLNLITIDVIRRDTLAASELIASPLERLTAHYPALALVTDDEEPAA